MATVVPLREMLDKETYERHEAHWSDIRMTMGWEPLPKTWEKFCEKMGWTPDAPAA